MAKSYRDLELFYRYLQENYPVPECPPVIITVCADDIVMVDGSRCNGFVRFAQDQIEIMVSLKRPNEWLVKKTLAHEYRHIMQRYLENWHAGTNPDYDDRMEVDARIFGQTAINNYRDMQKNVKKSMDSVVELLIIFGNDRQQLFRTEVRERYADCLNILKRHYSNLSEALSAVGEAIKEHPMYPHYSPRMPMPHSIARDYERYMRIGGIATGYNKLQAWARKNPHYFHLVT